MRSVVQPAIDQITGFFAEARQRPVSPRELLEQFFDLNYANRTVFLALTLDPSGLTYVDADIPYDELRASAVGAALQTLSVTPA